MYSVDIIFCSCCIVLQWTRERTSCTVNNRFFIYHRRRSTHLRVTSDLPRTRRAIRAIRDAGCSTRTASRRARPSGASTGRRPSAATPRAAPSLPGAPSGTDALRRPLRGTATQADCPPKIFTLAAGMTPQHTTTGRIVQQFESANLWFHFPLEILFLENSL